MPFDVFGAGTFDLPQARDESPDENAHRVAEERFGRFARGVVDTLAEGPLGRDELCTRVKGARVTTHITLPGRYLVLLPTVRHLGVSRRLEDEAERLSSLDEM